MPDNPLNWDRLQLLLGLASTLIDVRQGRVIPLLSYTDMVWSDFTIGDWRVRVFNDCGEFDAYESAQHLPTGVVLTSDDIYDDKLKLPLGSPIFHLLEPDNEETVRLWSGAKWGWPVDPNL